MSRPRAQLKMKLKQAFNTAERDTGQTKSNKQSRSSVHKGVNQKHKGEVVKQAGNWYTGS